MVYSAWDWDNLSYKYYEAPGDLPGTRPTVRKINEPDAGYGQQIEKLMVRLPAGAKYVGSGKDARGRIVSTGRDAGTGGELSPGLGSFGGFGDFGAVVEDGGPLVTNPWRTLGLWVLGIWISTKLAYWIGAEAEKSYRGQ